MARYLVFWVLMLFAPAVWADDANAVFYTDSMSGVPLFDVNHPNVVPPPSDLLPISTWGNPTRYRVGKPWVIAGNGLELIGEDGDRLLILRPDDPVIHRKGRADPQEMWIAQRTDQDTGVSRYLFMTPYTPSRAPKTADEREILGDLTWIALYRIDRRSGMTVEEISMRSLDNFSDALTDDVRVAYGGGRNFAWADPYRQLSSGQFLLEAIPDANLRANEEAAQRAANREEVTRVFLAMNKYWVRECDLRSVLRRGGAGEFSGSLLVSKFSNDKGACHIKTGLMSMWLSVESVDRRPCDFSAKTGVCNTTMTLGCRTHIGIGQEIDAVCPYLRLPQPVQIVFENSSGSLNILDVTSLAK